MSDLSVLTQFLPLKPRQYTRRLDLTDDIRIMLAISALYSMLVDQAWGLITQLSHKFKVSRTFIYQQASLLKGLSQLAIQEYFQDTCLQLLREQAIRKALCLRMEGRCSIGAISTLMKRSMPRFNCTGFISERLNIIGQHLGMNAGINADANNDARFVFASDEIFAKQRPILITVDPISSAILRIELSDSRSGQDWQSHFDTLASQHVKSKFFVSDGGSGLLSGASKAMPEVIHQADTYHAIPHVLGLYVHRLERKAYAAIEDEYRIEATFASAKSEEVIDKRICNYDQAIIRTRDAIRLYEDFCWLYHHLIQALRLFDHKGRLRTAQQAKQAVEVILELLETMDLPSLKDNIRKIRSALPNLFHYFDIAKESVDSLKNILPDQEAIGLYCLAWQYRKTSRLAKATKRKQQAKIQEALCLEMATGLIQEDKLSEQCIQFEIDQRLDQIIKSSSIVETINSLLRPYLNSSKNLVTQEMLNLFMFYHNHRRYVDGVRKGKTPMEILTAQTQELDWLELLMQQIDTRSI